MPVTKYHLAAIMFTDIVGYSVMMGIDENKAMELIRTSRDIHKRLIRKYNGRWLKEMGDGVLASFPSTSAAVYCAGALIQACSKQDINLRIGIHLGEVINDGKDIFGDGVNVASRIEPLAQPNEILISGPVNRDVKNKDRITTTFLIEKQLKNVDDPIKLYSVKVQNELLPETKKSNSGFRKRNIFILSAIIIIFTIIGFIIHGINKKNAENIKTKLRYEETSLAILPFRNLSNDPDKEYFAEGIAELIRSEIARISSLRVTSMTSTRQYRNTEKTIQEIGEELHVDHILEASVILEQDLVKIVVQLIDVKTDDHIWSDVFESKVEDMMNVQNELALKVANQLKISLSPEEKSALEERKVSINPKAYNLYLSGKRYQRQFFDSGDTLYNELAYRQFREALEQEPDFANAMVGLAWAYNNKSYYGSKSHLYNDSALLYINRAIDINPNLSESYVFLGFFYRYDQEDVDKSINAFKRAAELNPNDFYSLGMIGESYIDEKKFDLASEYLIKAFKINHSDVVPGYENANELHISNFIGRLMCDAGMFKEAEQFERQLLEYYPDQGHGFLGHITLRQGKFKEANEAYKYEYEKDTSSSIFLHWLAESYTYLDQFDSAEFYFRKLEKRYLENPELEIDFLITYRARMAYVLFNQGKTVEAERYLLQHIDKLKSMNDPSRWAYDIAYAYAYQGNVKESVKYLKKMDFWWVTYGLIKVDPMFNPIRGEPEFQQELYRMESEMMELRDELMIGRFEEELSWYFEK